MGSVGLPPSSRSSRGGECVAGNEEALTEPSVVLGRPCVRGKTFCVGSEKVLVRGVSYGTFQVDESGQERT